MTPGIDKLLAELKDELAVLYDQRFKGVYLYGSFARNEEDEESDLDVLIVLDRLEDYSTEIDRTSETIGALSLEYGVSISRVFATEDQWQKDQSLFFVNLRTEAVSA